MDVKSEISLNDEFDFHTYPNFLLIIITVMRRPEKVTICAAIIIPMV
jgi:hypothetical protein